MKISLRKFTGSHRRIEGIGSGGIGERRDEPVLDQLWSCGCDDVVEAFDTADIDRRELPAV